MVRVLTIYCGINIRLEIELASKWIINIANYCDRTRTFGEKLGLGCFGNVRRSYTWLLWTGCMMSDTNGEISARGFGF